MAYNYIKRAVGAAAGLTLGVLSYFSGTANAQEQPPKPEDLLKKQQAIHAKAYETYQKGKTEQDLQKKLEYFQQAKKFYQEAEAVQPGEQFPRAIPFLDEKIPELERQIKAKPAPAEKPAQPDNPAQPDKPKDFSSGGSAGEKTGIASLLAGQKKYDSLLELRGSLITEDREGDRQSISANIGTYAEAHLLREYLDWVNASGNKQNSRKISAMLDASPLILANIDQDKEYIREILRFGGTIENTKGTEWEYLEETLEDSNFKETYTENIRNIQTDEFYSLWAELKPELFLASIRGFYRQRKMRTESDALTATENKNDPSGNYSEARQTTIEDNEIYKGLAIAIGLTINNGIKGNASIINQFTQEYIHLAGTPAIKNDIYNLGLSGEIYTHDDTFGLAMAALEEISEDPAKKKNSMRKTSGHAAIAINISPISLEDNLDIEAVIFGDAWGQAYNNNTAEGEQHGGGIGIIIGSKTASLQQIIKLLSEKNMQRIGARPEISDELQDFLTARGFRNLPLGAISNENTWGFTVFAYGGASRETGLDSRQKTVPFAHIAAILDTPPIAFVLAGHYKEGILKREWGIDAAAHIKKHGFSVGGGFNQITDMSTDEIQRMIELYFIIPFGGTGKDKK